MRSVTDRITKEMSAHIVEPIHDTGDRQLHQDELTRERQHGCGRMGIVPIATGSPEMEGLGSSCKDRSIGKAMTPVHFSVFL
jgi:hypothetical protein